MARSEMTATIYRVQGMMAYVRENLSTDEFMLFLDLLVPEPDPEQVKPVKKRKRTKGSKSSRGTSIAGAIAGTAGSKPILCAYEMDGAVCHGAKDDAIHDKSMGYAGYHEFQPEATQAAGGG